MIKEQLTQARTLIKQKRYADARTILQQVDHPTAKDWLAKLDRLAPSKLTVRPDPDGVEIVEIKPKPDTLQIKVQLFEARDFIMQKDYDSARAILEQIDHPTAKKWLDKLTLLVMTQSAPANVTTRQLDTLAGNPLAAHDDILRQAQEALLTDQYDKARELLTPLKSPEAAFWLEKTGMTRFRTYENIWLDMFRYTLPPKALSNPEQWKCSTCQRDASAALTCPQRDQNPCPVKISTRIIEEPRRLALLLQALYLDQHQDIEKILIHIDPARLAHWKTELAWQVERMNPIDVRRATVEEAIPLLDQYAKASHTEPPAAPPLKLDQPAQSTSRAAIQQAAKPKPSQPQEKIRTSEQIEESLLRQIFSAIIRFFINQ